MQLLSTSLFNQREGVTRVRDGMRPKARRLRENSHAGMLRKRRGAQAGGSCRGIRLGTGCSPWCSDIPRCRQTCRAGYRPMDGGYGAAARNPRFCRLSSADAPHRLFPFGPCQIPCPARSGRKAGLFFFPAAECQIHGARWRRKASVALLAGVLWISRPSIFLRLRSSRVDFRPGICRFRASLNR